MELERQIFVGECCIGRLRSALSGVEVAVQAPAAHVIGIVLRDNLAGRFIANAFHQRIVLIALGLDWNAEQRIGEPGAGAPLVVAARIPGPFEQRVEPVDLGLGGAHVRERGAIRFVFGERERQAAGALLGVLAAGFPGVDRALLALGACELVGVFGAAQRVARGGELKS